MSTIVNFVHLLNSFLVGAIFMLIALCIQPEVVEIMRKVYTFSFEQKRKEDERNEAIMFKLIRLDQNLNKLYDISRDQCSDEMEESVGKAWDAIDEVIAEAKELVKNQE